MSEFRKVPVKDKGTGQASHADSARAKLSLPNRKAGSQVRYTPPAETPERKASENHISSTGGDANAATTEGSSVVGPDQVGEKRKTDQEIANLEHFIAQAYARKGQRISLKPSVESALARQPKLDREACERLLKLAREDVLLAVPRQLLLVFRDVIGYPMLKNTVREFVGEVLASHPVFSRPELASALKNLPDAPPPQMALAMVAKTDLPVASGTSGDKKLSPKALADLRTNATYCLALWFAETRAVSVESLNQYLFTALWQPAAKLARNDTERLYSLTDIRDLTGAGLVASAFQERAQEQARLAEVVTKGQETLREKVRILEAEREDLERAIRERDARFRALEQQLADEQRGHEHTRVHLGEDLENLRTRVLRRLKSEVGLLTEGLQALRRTPPKTNIMEDHAERALEGLNQEIQRLNSEK